MESHFPPKHPLSTRQMVLGFAVFFAFAVMSALAERL